MLEAIYDEPTRSDLAWPDIESLLLAAGAEIPEGGGSRLSVGLHGVRAILHRPDPASEAGKATVRSVRRFLAEAGVEP
jgi:hypothetical protein